MVINILWSGIFKNLKKGIKPVLGEKCRCIVNLLLISFSLYMDTDLELVFILSVKVYLYSSDVFSWPLSYASIYKGEEKELLAPSVSLVFPYPKSPNWKWRQDGRFLISYDRTWSSKKYPVRTLLTCIATCPTTTRSNLSQPHSSRSLPTRSSASEHLGDFLSLFLPIAYSTQHHWKTMHFKKRGFDTYLCLIK